MKFFINFAAAIQVFVDRTSRYNATGAWPKRRSNLSYRPALLVPETPHTTIFCSSIVQTHCAPNCPSSATQPRPFVRGLQHHAGVLSSVKKKLGTSEKITKTKEMKTGGFCLQ
jgi:hypothetical protein